MADVKQIERELKRLGGKATIASPRTLASSNSYSYPTKPKRLLGLDFRSMDLRGSFLLGKNAVHLREAEFLICDLREARAKHLDWMQELRSLRLVQFDGDIKPEFMEFLQRAGRLQHLTFYKSTINERHLSVLQGLSHIESIVFADCDLEPAAVVEMRRHMPGVVLAYKYENGRVVKSQLPPAKLPRKAFADEADKALRRMHEALAELKPPAANRFNGPITKDQRADLEKTLGFVLPGEIAAMFNQHCGQPAEDDQLICLAPFHNPDLMIGTFRFQLSFGWGEYFWSNYRDTTGSYHRLLLPFMGADVVGVHINLLTGQVVETGEYGGSLIASSVHAFLDRITTEIKAGRFTRSGNRIDLKAHVSDLRDKTCPDFSA